MGMRRHPRGDSAFVGVTPTQAGVAYQPAAILNKEPKDRWHIHSLSGNLQMAGDVWLHNLLALGCFPGLSSWPAIAPIQLPKHV